MGSRRHRLRRGRLLEHPRQPLVWLVRQDHRERAVARRILRIESEHLAQAVIATPHRAQFGPAAVPTATRASYGVLTHPPPTATTNAAHTAAILESASRPSRVPSDATGTLSTKSRFTAAR